MSTIYRTSLSRLCWQRFREIMRRITVLLFAFGAVALAVSLSRAHASPCDKYCGLRQEAHLAGHARHHVRHVRHFRPRHRRHVARHRIHHRLHHVRLARSRAHLDANGNVATRIIGGRPSGCPHAYCGCGLARYLGLSDKRLNLAWNWARLFPHTRAHAGAAAVRHHHVMLLVRHVAGRTWIVRDYNSGRGLSRVHARYVGPQYVFVDPYRRTARR